MVKNYIQKEEEYQEEIQKNEDESDETLADMMEMILEKHSRFRVILRNSTRKMTRMLLPIKTSSIE